MVPPFKCLFVGTTSVFKRFLSGTRLVKLVQELYIYVLTTNHIPRLIGEVLLNGISEAVCTFCNCNLACNKSL